GGSPRRHQVVERPRPDDLHELAPPRRGPGSVRRRRPPEPRGALDSRVGAGTLPRRRHIDHPGHVPSPCDAGGPRGPGGFARSRGGQGQRRLHRRSPDLRRRRGTGARPRGDDRPRAEGHHIPASRFLAGTTLSRPHPGVGSPVTPSPFAQIVTVASYEIRKYIRGRRPLGMLILLGLIVGLFALLKGTVAATVLTFFLFTLIFAIVGGILPRANVEPWFIPTSASGIIANALGGAAVRPGPGGGDVGFVPDPATSLLVFAGYAIAG